MGQSEEWCRYQASGSVMMALLKMSAAWYQLSFLFLSQDVPFRCVHTFNQSKDNSVDSPNASLKRDSWDDSCGLVGVNGSELSCNRWQYHHQDEEGLFTVNMMWDLVCERQWLNTWAQFSFMTGVFSGNLVGGFMAERVGRKPVLVMCVLLQPLVSAVVAIAPWFSLFVLTRFLLGLCLGGTIVISFLLGGELAMGPLRSEITILHQVPFGIGQTLLPLAGYFLRDWRELQLALSLFSLIFLPYCWLVEESPKWLEATGRVKQAERVKQIIRSRNGVPAATNTEMCPMTEKHHVEIVKVQGRMLNNNSTALSETGFAAVFRSASLCHCSFAVWLMWYFAGLSFFALNAYQTALGGDPYLNVGVGGLVGGIPGNILTILLVRKFSKKKITLIAHIFVAIFAILVPIYDVGETPWDWSRRVPALLTLMAMSVAYPVMFLLSGELLPAPVRGIVMMVANLAARLGNTTAPLVGPTAVFHRWTPMLIIASAPVFTVLLMLTLSDNKNTASPINTQDIEASDREPPDNCRLSREEEGKIYKPGPVEESKQNS